MGLRLRGGVAADDDAGARGNSETVEQWQREASCFVRDDAPVEAACLDRRERILAAGEQPRVHC